MREKEPAFTVTDRRKFTSEGELRDEQPPSLVSVSPVVEENYPPAPDASAALTQNQEYIAVSAKLDEMVTKANPGQPGAPPVSFEALVQSLYMSAAMQMGIGENTTDQPPRIDIMGAREAIDTLGMLEEKSRGNLSELEKRLLQNALFDLRGPFLELTRRLMTQAQKASRAGRPS